MRKPKTFNTEKEQLRLLFVGSSERDCADLRKSLTEADRQVHLEHAASPQDAANQLGKGRYDLLLCSRQSTDVVAFQLLRQVRQYDSRVPVLFLGDCVDEDAIEAAIALILEEHQDWHLLVRPHNLPLA